MEQIIEQKTKIKQIIESISNPAKRKGLENLLEDYNDNNDSAGLSRWYNLYILSEKQIGEVLNHIKYLGSGTIEEEDKRVSCDLCAHTLKNYHIISLGKSKGDDVRIFIGGTCWPTLKRELETLNLNDSIIKDIKDKQQEEIMSVEQLESYRIMLSEEIKELKKRRNRILNDVEKFEVEAPAEEVSIKIKNMKAALFIYEHEIQLRDLVLRQYEDENFEIIAKAMKMDMSVLERDTEIKGTILSRLEQNKDRLSSEQRRIINAFKYNRESIPQYMFPVLKMLWAKSIHDPKEAVLGEHELDIRLLHHLDNAIISGNIHEYATSRIIAQKKHLESLKQESPELINTEYLRTRRIELEALQYIMQLPKDKAQRIHKIAGHVKYSEISDLLDTKENITRLEAMQIIGSLQERENTRENVNKEFLKEIEKRFNINSALQKWLSVYEKDKKIRAKKFRDSNPDMEEEEKQEYTLSLHDYSLLKRISSAFNITGGKHLSDISSGFSIAEFEQAIYMLMGLERKEEINKVKNTNLVVPEAFMKYINGERFSRKMKTLTKDKESIKKNYDAIIDTAIEYCNQLTSHTIELPFEELLNRLSSTDSRNIKGLNELVKALRTDIEAGLVDKSLAEKILNIYDQTKDYKRIDLKKIAKIESVKSYSAEQYRLNRQIFWRENIEFYREKDINKLEDLYLEAEAIDKALSDNIKKASLLRNRRKLMIDSVDSFETSIVHKEPIKVIRQKYFSIYDSKEILDWNKSFQKEYMNITQEGLYNKIKKLGERFELYLMKHDYNRVQESIRDINNAESVWVKREEYEKLERLVKDAETLSVNEEEKNNIKRNYKIKHYVPGFRFTGDKSLYKLWETEDGKRKVKWIAYKCKNTYSSEKASAFIELIKEEEKR